MSNIALQATQRGIPVATVAIHNSQLNKLRIRNTAANELHSDLQGLDWIASSWHNFWTWQYPLLHEANPSNIEVSSSKTSKTLISYRFECSNLWSKQHKAITTRLTFCMYASILSTHSRSKPRNSMDRTITVVSSLEAATSHHFLVQVYITNYLKLHPLLSWGAYPKPFRKPAHSLKRMTSTGRSRHIGSSRSVWWILVTRYLPKLTCCFLWYAWSMMTDIEFWISHRKSPRHWVVAQLHKLIWYVTGCWQLQWRSFDMTSLVEECWRCKNTPNHSKALPISDTEKPPTCQLYLSL